MCLDNRKDFWLTREFARISKAKVRGQFTCSLFCSESWARSSMPLSSESRITGQLTFRVVFPEDVSQSARVTVLPPQHGVLTRPWFSLREYKEFDSKERNAVDSVTWIASIQSTCEMLHLLLACSSRANGERKFSVLCDLSRYAWVKSRGLFLGPPRIAESLFHALA